MADCHNYSTYSVLVPFHLDRTLAYVGRTEAAWKDH